MKEYSISKMLFITSNILLIGYLCVFICVNAFKINETFLSEGNVSFMALVIAWIPLLILIAICVMYNFLIFSDKYRKIKSLIYTSVVTFGLLVFIVFTPTVYFEEINVTIVNSIIILLSIVNITSHLKLGKNLIKIQFNISHELIMLRRVNEKADKSQKQKWSKILDRSAYLFVLPFIIRAENIIFIILSIIISCFILYSLFRYLYYCKEIKAVVKLRPIMVYITYILFISLGIAAYCLFYFKLPSLILLYASLLPKFIIDNKYARFLYSQLENKVYLEVNER